ncbi:MAG: hypothetical protein ABIN95_00650 [Mucilaginibacter sp.]
MNKLLKLVVYAILFAAPVYTQAQCLSGDCKNGTGKFDFAYAVYTGEFKNGLPEGKGLMDYGNGQTYNGYFKKGVEDGEGILTKKGVAAKVFYRNGKIETQTAAVVIGGNTPKMDGCTGDCYNGYGVMKFPSGNTYSGNFSNSQFSGHGVMVFASGNVLDADFAGHLPQSGTFTYKQENATFKGTFNADGTPLTGRYDYPNTGTYVEVTNGRITATHNPKQEAEAAAKAEHDRYWMVCPACGGAGGKSIASSWESSRKTYVGTIYDEYTITTNYGPPTPHICLKCNGKGSVKRR